MPREAIAEQDRVAAPAGECHLDPVVHNVSLWASGTVPTSRGGSKPSSSCAMSAADVLGRPAVDRDREVGGGFVDRAALGGQRLDLFAHVVDLKKRSATVVPGAFDDEVDAAPRR